mgnify:FL=1
MEINEKQKNRVTAYKWIKVIQAVLMIVLGAAFILIGAIRINDEGNTSVESISYCIGTAFAAYGVISVISGYLLERSPTSKEVIMGILTASLGTTLLIKPEILTEVFPFFLIVLFYGFAAVLIAFGIDKIRGKEFSKNIPSAVLIFVISGILIALATTYIFFYKNKELLNYILVILGLILVVFGCVSMGMLFVKVHNTNKQIKAQEIEKEQKQKVETELKNTNTKIIDISELKKKNDKKVHRKPIETMETKLIADDSDTDNEEPEDDKKEETPSYQDPVIVDDSKDLKKQ